MRNHVSHAALALLIGAAAFACSGKPNPDRDKGDIVRLEGCVQAAPGHNQYVLQDVVNVAPAEEPRGNVSMEHGRAVLDGSWTRLSGGSTDLAPFLGKRVMVDGRVADTGGNTMGTAGSTDPQTALRESAPDASSTTDRGVKPSTVPPRGANANGWAALIAAEHISKLSETCASQKEKYEEGNTGRGPAGAAPPQDNPGPGSHR